MRNDNKVIGLLMLGLLSLVLLACFTSADVDECEYNRVNQQYGRFLTLMSNSSKVQCFRRAIPGKLCRTLKPRYHYLVADNMCRVFMWGGCKDPDDSVSVNRFETKEECEKKCKMLKNNLVFYKFK